MLILPSAISDSYAAESEDLDYDFTILAGEDLIDNPLAAKILENIEIAKQKFAEQQEKQRLAEENQWFLEEQRQIAEQLLQNDLDRMNKRYEDYTPKASFETFLSGIDPSVHDVFWGQFDFQQQKAKAGYDAMVAVLENGGSWEEARQAYFENAATTRTEVIEVNKNLNIQYGFADTTTQQNFDEFGKLPRSEEPSQPTEPVIQPDQPTKPITQPDEPVSLIKETETKSTPQINFVENQSNDKCLKWDLKAQKFIAKGKFVPPGIAKKVSACNNSHDSQEPILFLLGDIDKRLDRLDAKITQLEALIDKINSKA